MRKHPAFRTMLRMLAACLCAALLAACSGGQTDASHYGDVREVVPAGPVGQKSDGTLHVWALSKTGSLSALFSNLKHYEAGFTIDVEYAYDNTKNGLMTGGDLIDKLHLLNTRLLAGEGPDVILLDGCPVESMVTAGVLRDLSEVAQKAGVYQNLVDSLAVDGKLYYLPYRVNAPLLAGDPAQLDDVESFTDLAALMQAKPVRPAPVPFEALEGDPLLLRVPPLPEEEQAVAGFNYTGEVFDLAEMLYGPWLVKDNGLDRDALAEFFRQAKAVAEAAGVIGNYEHRVSGLGSGLGGVASGAAATQQYMGYARYMAATTKDYGATSQMLAVVGRAKYPSYTVRPFPAQGAVWQPYLLMGVSVNAKQPELAERFLELVLSDEQQVARVDEYGILRGDFSGLPVTESAAKQTAGPLFDEMLQSCVAECEAVYAGDEAALQAMAWLKQGGGYPYDLDALLRSFDTAHIPDGIVYRAVYTNGLGYIEGRKALEEAVAQCAGDLELYFAEKQR